MIANHEPARVAVVTGGAQGIGPAVADEFARRSTIGGAHYTAAKAGVLGLTRHLSREVARHGITVNAVCPGLIDTEMVRATIAAEAVDRYAASFPIARLADAEEVASLVAFLASDEAAYITGASVDINAGDLTI